MSFLGSQVISGSQGRNPRLNEYFAVVGLPEGPLMVADVSSNFADCSSRSNEGRSVHAPGGHIVEEDSCEGEDDDDEGDFDDDDDEGDDLDRDIQAPAPLEALQRRRRTYGSSELGRMMTRIEVGEAPLAMRYRARVLHRFPAYDHDGSAFPTNLALFCLPGGLKLSLEMKLPIFFTFVHTRANGQRMFGYCISLYEPLGDSHRKDLQEAMDAHNHALRQGRRGSNTSATAGDADSPGAGVDPGQAGSRGIEGVGPGKAGAPRRGSLDGPLDPSAEVFAPKCLCLLSTWPFFEQFRQWFLNLYRISLSPSKIPLERFIGNFMLEVPAPSPGRVEVMYNMGNSTISFTCPSFSKPLAWSTVPFKPLFECLSHENILKVFTCLLHERSLLLKSSQLNLLTACAEVLIVLLYPLSWTHVYIPVLPETLLGVLSAPMPFLMGVHRSYLENAHMEMPPHVVQVDLDNNVVEVGMFPIQVELPQRRQSKLLAKLERYANLKYCLTREYREDVLFKSDLAFPMAERPSDKARESAVEPPDWNAVREAFLRFFVALLSGYQRFFVCPSKQNPSPMQLFNTEGFLEKVDRDCRQFTAMLCRTQSFQNFVDMRIQPEEDEVDGDFFDLCITARKSRTARVMRKDTALPKPEASVKVKTVYALTPDTSGLDMDAPPAIYSRFPDLSMEMYPIPRDIPSLSRPPPANGRVPPSTGGLHRASSSRSIGNMAASMFGSKEPSDVRDGSGSGVGNWTRGNDAGSAVGGVGPAGRGVFRMGSVGSEAYQPPLTAEATIYAIFIVGFCETIGFDSPSAARSGAGYTYWKGASEKPRAREAPSSFSTKTSAAYKGETGRGASNPGPNSVAGSVVESGPASDTEPAADRAGIVHASPTGASPDMRDADRVVSSGSSQTESIVSSGPSGEEKEGGANSEEDMIRVLGTALEGSVRTNPAPPTPAQQKAVLSRESTRFLQVEATSSADSIGRTPPWEKSSVSSRSSAESLGIQAIAADTGTMPRDESSVDALLPARRSSSPSEGRRDPGRRASEIAAPVSTAKTDVGAVGDESLPSSDQEPGETIASSAVECAPTSVNNSGGKVEGKGDISLVENTPGTEAASGEEAAEVAEAVATVNLRALEDADADANDGVGAEEPTPEAEPAAVDASHDVPASSKLRGVLADDYRSTQDAATVEEMKPGSILFNKSIAFDVDDNGKMDRGEDEGNGHRTSPPSLDSSNTQPPPSLSPIASLPTPAPAPGLPGADAPRPVDVGGSGNGFRKRDDRRKQLHSSRLAFSELKLDVKEERLYRANEALGVAFEVLNVMLKKAPAGDEAVYRSLISACGRCGNSEKAMAIVEMMMSTGIVPDTMVSRCLVDAFAMDDTFMGAGTHPLALLDRSKYQPRTGKRLGYTTGSLPQESPFSFKRIMGLSMTAPATNPPPGTPTPPPQLEATAASFRTPTETTPTSTGTAGGTIDSSSASTSTRTSPGSSFLPSIVGGMESINNTPVAGVSAAGRSNGRSPEPAPQGVGGTPVGGVSSGSDPQRERGGRGEQDSGGGEGVHAPDGVKSRESGDNWNSSDPRTPARDASPLTSPAASASLAMHTHVFLGERMLESLFPSLKIDTDSETCPSCKSRLSAEDVQMGWSPDPNDYTSQCRAQLDLKVSPSVTGSGVMASAPGWLSRSTAQNKGADGSDASIGFSRTSRGTYLTTCGRRFVPRFSVHSTAANWEGSTGPGTPLWCEFLSPWVLRKEFHNVLAAYGAQYLCSPRFRLGLGPEDGLPRLESSGKAGERAVDRTIFWNLVMHFRVQSLPISFLLADEAGSGSDE